MSRKKATPAHILHDSCANCRFWRRLDDSLQIPDEDVIGECIRFPPTIVEIEEGSDEPIQAVPVTEARFCCGEHKRAVN